MANPKLPGIPEAEQALLYAKLNEYNRGRMSYKEAGAYFVVLPRPGHPTYSVWIYSPTLEKNRLLFIHELSADINESLRMASTLFFLLRRCLLIVEYNEKRMQSNGDDIISFGRYRGHYLHEIHESRSGLPELDSLQIHTQNPQAGAFCSHSASISLCTSGHHATKGTAETRSRPFSGQRG